MPEMPIGNAPEGPKEEPENGPENAKGSIPKKPGADEQREEDHAEMTRAYRQVPKNEKPQAAPGVPDEGKGSDRLTPKEEYAQRARKIREMLE